MYKTITFYTNFHYGDVFESREFVKEWMRLVPAEKYYYAHDRNPRVLLDIPQLEYTPLTKSMQPINSVIDDRNGNLYVNTWLGRHSRYILPGMGCTVEKMYEMHNDMLRASKLGQLSREPVDYVPEIDYDVYKSERINNFLEIHKGQDLILIDNGLVESNQAKNFPFHNIIYTLSQNFKDKSFIVTQKLPVELENVFDTDSITGRPGGFDLNEISFLSLFCRVIIGRSSGAYTFSQVKENVHNPNKKLLAFTFHKLGSSFIVNTPLEIQKYWSSAISEDSVYTNIRKVIE